MSPTTQAQEDEISISGSGGSVLGRRISRRTMLRGTVFGIAGLSAAALIGCSDDDDDDDSDVDPGTRSALPDSQTYDLVDGWVRQQATEYFDFGMNSPLNAATNAVGVAPIYAFATGVTNGAPDFVSGQHNIIDVVPGDEGHSDLWEVNLVIVDDAYEAESITSKAALDAAIDDEGYDVMKPGLFVNCPVVGADSTLEEGKELTQGWYPGEPVFYPDFGGNDPVAIPIWAFITGFNDDGTPAFVEGQNNVIDVVKGEAGYSAFWRVNLVQLGAAYEANTLTSAAQVAASGLAVTETDLVVNCPVVRPDATTANAEPRAPAVVRSRQPEQKEYDLVEGWYRGEDVVYYDFAMNSPLDAATSAVGIAPIYAFANGIGADGSPNFVDGQHNVIDLLPGDEGYSDLWQVHLVLVDDNYEAGTITSKAGIDATRYQQQVTNLLVNCPVVGAGSALETGKELVNGYYRERDVFYPDFGGNVAVAIPIWAFVTGFDEDGNPQFVEGQRNIIDAVPADEGYSAFWRVNLVMVDASYEANSLKSREDVEGSGLEVVQTDLVVNCPVVERT